MKTQKQIKQKIEDLENFKGGASFIETNLDKLDGVLEALKWVISDE